MFSYLFALAESKEAWVVDVWHSSGEEGGWNPHLLRPFSDWEVDLVEHFIDAIQGKKMILKVEDTVV